MKKTLTVNISGSVFYIDDDAFARLDSYLRDIEKHFRNTPEGKEIIDDIESRIAELLQEKLSGKNQPVTLTMVNEVVHTLGEPEDIGEFSEEGPSSSFRENPRSSRRIYRDPDDRIMGGICAGLAAYFDAHAWIIRGIFIFLFLAGGSGLLIYLIMWLVIPLAKTRAEKLEMRGEPVNLSNLGKTVKDEFNNVRKNMRI